MVIQLSRMQFAMTASLQGMLEQAEDMDTYFAIFETLDASVIAMEQLQKMVGKVEALKIMRKYLDDAIEESNRDATHEIKCKKGCAFCCRIAVDTTQTEAKVVVAYAKNHNIPMDLNVLKEQAAADNNTRLMMQHNRCVFLGDDNLCKVYPVRPNACRKYFVVSAPKNCEPTPENIANPHSIQVSASMKVEILASAIINCDNSGNFSQQLLNELT